MNVKGLFGRTSAKMPCGPIFWIQVNRKTVMPVFSGAAMVLTTLPSTVTCQTVVPMCLVAIPKTRFYGNVAYEQAAFYGNVEYVLNDEWKLFAGIRYNDDHKEHLQNDFTGISQLVGVDGNLVNAAFGIFRNKNTPYVCCGYICGLR